MSVAWQSSAWVDVAQENGTLVLRLCGELDLASSAVVEPIVMAALATAESVLLDLAELTFCDSSGLGVLIAASQRVDRRGSSFAVCNLQPAVRRVFDVADLGARIEVRD
jgi:stage II sporulation protein AA (anti-sigma F factor antagonist)